MMNVLFNLNEFKGLRTTVRRMSAMIAIVAIEVSPKSPPKNAYRLHPI